MLKAVDISRSRFPGSLPAGNDTAEGKQADRTGSVYTEAGRVAGKHSPFGPPVYPPGPYLHRRPRSREPAARRGTRPASGNFDGFQYTNDLTGVGIKRFQIARF
ncbi:MAG TPA: hypothetical protein DEB39_06855 [Planctomycetaceae bacterium]|nr:hypothetical protein [Planctomycetaceae bacterium]